MRPWVSFVKDDCTDLSSTVSREGVVPKALERTGHWLLIVVMVAVSACEGYEAENGVEESHPGSIESKVVVRCGRKNNETGGKAVVDILRATLRVIVVFQSDFLPLGKQPSVIPAPTPA
jgi:hypothetical protein